jgi:hypothetical protein
VCHNFFRKALVDFHQARVKSLLACTAGLVRGQKLTLTAIGRNMPGRAKVKHDIKRVDRLLGNRQLQQELPRIYQAVGKAMVDGLPYCLVAIDWSGCCSAQRHVLRASLLYQGRAVVLMNTVVDADEQESPEVQERFLEELAEMFGPGKRVYIISDAGFKTPWFNKIRALGWHFIGRVRGHIHGCLEGGDWAAVSELSCSASSKPAALGAGWLGKTARTRCPVNFHLYRAPAKGRHKHRGRLQRQYPDADQMYRASANEPWLLVTSDATLPSRDVVRLYGKRMQIEQNFRDDKSQRYGFAWHHSQTTSAARIAVLCMLATLATRLLWLIGVETERLGLHRNHQANSIRNRRVLSFLSLARSVINHEHRSVTTVFLNQARQWLTQSYGSVSPLGT